MATNAHDKLGFFFLYVSEELGGQTTNWSYTTKPLFNCFWKRMEGAYVPSCLLCSIWSLAVGGVDLFQLLLLARSLASGSCW
jgi:hypothetical protein